MNKQFLDLHFDVNKTIIFRDSIKGFGTKHTSNGIISNNVFGTVYHDSESKNDTDITDNNIKRSNLRFKPIVIRYPKKSNVSFKQERDYNDYENYELNEMKNYSTYCKKDAFIMGKSHDDKKKNKMIKKKYSDMLVSSFTDKGQPGSKYNSFCRELMDKCKIDVKTLSIKGVENLKDNYGDLKEWFLFPSFLRLIEYLNKEDYRFSITFRTFGNDLETVAAAWNKFCLGKHPLFPNIKMSERVQLNHACFVRRENDNYLVVDHPDSKNKDCAQFYPEKLNIQKLSDSKYYTVYKGHKEIYQYLKSKSDVTMCCVDDFMHWHVFGDRKTGGKLFVIDKKLKNTHSIFFDDNIRDIYDVNNLSNIVDTRDLDTGKEIPIHEIYDKNVVRVETWSAVLDIDYYCKKIYNSLNQ